MHTVRNTGSICNGIKYLNKAILLHPRSRPAGLSLGWRLALSAAQIIMLVMGVVSVSQQLFMLEKDRQVHEMLLKKPLVPRGTPGSSFTLDSMRRRWSSSMMLT